MANYENLHIINSQARKIYSEGRLVLFYRRHEVFSINFTIMNWQNQCSDVRDHVYIDSYGK